MGRHKRPFYRIIVTDSQSPRDGRFVEILGTYDPLSDQGGVNLKEERAIGWLKKGAEVSETVRSLFTKAQLFKKVKESNTK